MSQNPPPHDSNGQRYYPPYYQPALYLYGPPHAPPHGLPHVPPHAAPPYGYFPPPPQWSYPGPYPPYQHVTNIYHGVTEGGESASTPTAPTAPQPEEASPYEDSKFIVWIPTTVSECMKLQSQALVAGKEGWDGSPLWICRARIAGDMVPGKVVPKHSVACVPYDGHDKKVISMEVTFKVLCTAKPEMFTWISCSNGGVPPTAIVGGRTSSGESLYIGRAPHMGSITPGKIHQSHGCLYIAFGGKELAHKTYEVLCKSISMNELLRAN